MKRPLRIDGACAQARALLAAYTLDPSLCEVRDKGIDWVMARYMKSAPRGKWLADPSNFSTAWLLKHVGTLRSEASKRPLELFEVHGSVGAPYGETANKLTEIVTADTIPHIRRVQLKVGDRLTAMVFRRRDVHPVRYTHRGGLIEDAEAYGYQFENWSLSDVKLGSGERVVLNDRVVQKD